MISKKMEKAINKQINAEIYSSYLYFAMEAYFNDQGLSGFANWMRIQTQEELTHALKMVDFINERGGRVMLEAIEKPTATWKDPLVCFMAVAKHEAKVTKLINELMSLAIEEKDHATSSFLQWFVDEQVEEEASADDIVQKLKLVEKAPGGWYLLDKELATRVFHPPVAE